MLKTIPEWTDVELQKSANRVREHVRKRVLQEAVGEIRSRRIASYAFQTEETNGGYRIDSSIDQIALFS
jgi:hypothetical protein